MNNKKLIVNLCESELESVSGGWMAVFGATNSLEVSKEEYDKLVEAGYIVDGKIAHDGEKGIRAAVSFLGEKGFQGACQPLCFMWKDYKAPQYGTIVIKDN